MFQTWDQLRCRNAVLASLPPSELALLRPSLERVPLSAGQVLQEFGCPIDRMYFVEDGLVSLVAETGERNTVEVALIGCDGPVGAWAIVRAGSTAGRRAVVQMAGSALALPIRDLRRVLDEAPVLRERCLSFLHAQTIEMSQLAACGIRHELPQRLSRWLLTASDRAGRTELTVTQDSISHLLGVRRAGISVAANALQARGLVRQSRGRLTVMDRDGLQAQACCCYRIIQQSRQRLMHDAREPVRLDRHADAPPLPVA